MRPSEWIPFIFADGGPGFRDKEEAEEVMEALLHLYDAANESVRAKEPRLPPGCVFLHPPLADLEPEAPVSQWARGFSAGHVWLEEVWDRYLPEQMGKEIGAACLGLRQLVNQTELGLHQTNERGEQFR